MSATPRPVCRNPRYERWRWQIFGITWLAYAGFYLTRKAFSVAKNELKRPEIMGLTKADMSWIDGAKANCRYFKRRDAWILNSSA